MKYTPLCAVTVKYLRLNRLVVLNGSIQGGPKIGTIALYASTLPNTNRFSKLFHYQNQEEICNNTIAKDLTTSQCVAIN